MPFKDFDEFAAEPITLGYRGKKYTLPMPDVETGLRLTRMIAESQSEDSQFADMPIEDLWKMLLADVYDEMLADKVPHAFLTRVALTSMSDFQYGREVAEMVWEAGADPKAMQAYLNRNSDLPDSISSDEATMTPSPAPTNGTTKARKRSVAQKSA